jgi:hypothetical protein
MNECNRCHGEIAPNGDHVQILRTRLVNGRIAVEESALLCPSCSVTLEVFLRDSDDGGELAEWGHGEIRVSPAFLRAVGAHARGRVDRICETCSKVFSVRLGDLRAGHKAGRFCSRKCSGGGRPRIAFKPGDLVEIPSDSERAVWTVDAIRDGGMVALLKVCDGGYRAIRVEPARELRHVSKVSKKGGSKP